MSCHRCRTAASSSPPPGRPVPGGSPAGPLAPPDKQPPELKVPDRPEKTVGWAIVGLGKLALEEVMPAFAACQLSRPAALVSGHPEKAKRAAAAYGIDPRKVCTYDTYDRLADDPAVQVVYIILPNSMHAEYTVRGFKAGKHVLCEKPLAVTAAACERMIVAGMEAGKQLMTAYRRRYEPFNLTAIDLCRRGCVLRDEPNPGRGGGSGLWVGTA